MPGTLAAYSSNNVMRCPHYVADRSRTKRGNQLELQHKVGSKLVALGVDAINKQGRATDGSEIADPSIGSICM